MTSSSQSAKAAANSVSAAQVGKPDTRAVTPRQTEREKPQRHAEIAEGNGKFFGTHIVMCVLRKKFVV